MSDTDGSGQAARLAALAGQVDRLARGQASAAEKLGQVEQFIKDLAEAITALARPTPGVTVQSWLWPTDPQAGTAGPVQLDPDQAVAMFDDLVSWLARVYLRYEGAALPTCWAWHPDVVEELLWLRGAHAAAYSGSKAAWELAGTWHERQRPGVVKRIRESAGRCELTQHRQQSPAAVVPLAGRGPAVAAAWAMRREQPDVTASALDEAERYAEARHR